MLLDSIIGCDAACESKFPASAMLVFGHKQWGHNIIEKYISSTTSLPDLIEFFFKSILELFLMKSHDKQGGNLKDKNLLSDF